MFFCLPVLSRILDSFWHPASLRASSRPQWAPPPPPPLLNRQMQARGAGGACWRGGMKALQETGPRRSPSSPPALRRATLSTCWMWWAPSGPLWLSHTAWPALSVWTSHHVIIAQSVCFFCNVVLLTSKKGNLKCGSHLETCLLINTFVPCLSSLACSSFQEVVCSGAEGLWGHWATHQVILSYCAQKHPRQVDRISETVLFYFFQKKMFMWCLSILSIFCSCCHNRL